MSMKNYKPGQLVTIQNEYLKYILRIKVNDKYTGCTNCCLYNKRSLCISSIMEKEICIHVQVPPQDRFQVYFKLVRIIDRETGEIIW